MSTGTAALPEVVRAAELLADGWAGRLPADAAGRERYRQLCLLLRRHDPALAAHAQSAGTDLPRLQQALAGAARQDPAVRSLLGQLRQPAPRAAPADAQVCVEGSNNRVVVGGTVHMLAELGMDPSPPPARVLFLAANPMDTSPLRLDQEQRDIREALALTGGRYTLETRPAARPRDLTLALMQLRPRIVHYSGHAQSGGALCLENEHGETHPVTKQALASVFGVLTGEIECVVLNACYSAVQAEEIGRHAKYVVGMTSRVGDRAAVAFATGFYQALGSGATVPQSMAMGRGLFEMLGLPEELAPVLLQNGAAV